jgi:hypothetical protein
VAAEESLDDGTTTRDMRTRRSDWDALAIWKVFFGILAVLDLWSCCVEVGTGGGGVFESGGGGGNKEQAKHHHQENNHRADHENTNLFLLITISFNIACFVESIWRGHLARQLALEHRTLQALEQRLQQGVRSTLRSSLHIFQYPTNEQQLEELVARTTSLRTYLPMLLVIGFWLSLLPMTAYYWDGLVRSCGLPLMGIRSSIMEAKQKGNGGDGDDDYGTLGGDAALATYYLTQFISHASYVADLVQDVATKIVWDVVMPYHIVFQPRRWLARVKILLRAIKYVRFAFPLCRIGVKVLDQLFALRKVYRQSAQADANMKRRRGRPSLLLADLKRVESLAKLQMNLAEMPSQIFQYCATGHQLIVQQTLRYHQVQGRQLQRFFRKIKRDIRRNAMFWSDQYYDTIVRVSQEVQNSVLRPSRTKLFSLSSRHDHHNNHNNNNLLSPRSRFSIIWRLTVTNVLLLEIVRLVLSYHLSDGTFQLGIRHMIRQTLYIHCQQQPRAKDKFWQDKFAAIGHVVNDIRRNISKAIPILPMPPPSLLAIQQELCIPSSRSARYVLQLGGAVEHFIDLVSFLDIFLWFYTGDIDDETGLVVPKPFITRMIIPGTLVQVLDHPTLPELLPSLLRHILNFCRAIGYARAIRWMLAIVPCCAMVVHPIKSYVFDQTIDTSRGIMSYVDSLGMLGPTTGGGGGYARRHSDGGDSLWDSSGLSYSSGSQVGLSFEDSLRSLNDREEEEEDDRAVPLQDSRNDDNNTFATQYQNHHHAKFIRTTTTPSTDDSTIIDDDDTYEQQEQEQHQQQFPVVTPSPPNLRQRRRRRIGIRRQQPNKSTDEDGSGNLDDSYRFSYSSGGALHME